MEINLMDYIIDQALILIPSLYVLGIMLKQSGKIKDWTIPFFLLPLGIVGAISLMGLNANAIIQGILTTGAAVLSNQLIKQSINKREQD
ncbi:phage holin family protein [Clostridium botulinum]|uniref:phage holin family protein n=1 Tax=Clostridium botulinum TaxID=1491 RepID=UPI0011171119|nr:phage holin family protein [Clostridium botulinum]